MTTKPKRPPKKKDAPPVVALAPAPEQKGFTPKPPTFFPDKAVAAAQDKLTYTFGLWVGFMAGFGMTISAASALLFGTWWLKFLWVGLFF